MSQRLHTELHRLFGTPLPTSLSVAAAAAAAGPDPAPAAPSPNPPEATPADPSTAPVWAAPRALVLELAHPAEWEPLAQVWRGVQVELELPAPAIAVSGQAGFQLWFALAEPLPPAQGAAFLEGLCRRWLAELRPTRLRSWPSAAAPGGPDAASLPPVVPAEQPPGGRWSAFVSADLAPVFADTPWLEIPPGDEAQARLLAPLQPIAPAAFAAALQALAPPVAAPAAEPVRAGSGAEGLAPTPPALAGISSAPGPFPQDDPRAFLLAVMNDAAVPLALRIEAARALLAVPERAG